MESRFGSFIHVSGSGNYLQGLVKGVATRLVESSYPKSKRAIGSGYSLLTAYDNGQAETLFPGTPAIAPTVFDK